MAGTMSELDLVADLKRSLHDCAAVFNAANDGDFVRFLKQALPDMSWKRPLTQLGQVTISANEPRFSLMGLPAFHSYKVHVWQTGAYCPQPWEVGYAGAIPRISSHKDAAGHWLAFEPAPSAAHIALRGSAFKFYYFALHSVGAAPETTIAVADRGLLLLRAQAEAMLELTLRNAAKPVQLRDGLSGTPRNSTPAALHATLLALFAEAR